MGFFKRFVKAITNPTTLIMAAVAVALAPATGGASLSLLSSAAFWTNVAITAAVMAGAQALSAPPKLPSFSDFIGELQGRTQMIKQPTVPRRVIYGKARVSGVLGFIESTNDDQHLHMIIMLAGHEVNSIGTIYVNDEEFELNSQSSENLNFFSQIKSKFNTIVRDTVTDEIALEVNESVKEIKQIKEKETQAPIENEFWTVQLGSYRDLNNAKGEIVSLRDLNFNAYIKEDKVDDVSEYKVRVGSELTRNMAEEISSNLKMNNYENQLVPYN